MHCKLDDTGNPVAISRAEARTAGYSHYFTGKPCINGHTTFRSVSHKACIECHRLRVARERAAKPELIRERKAADYAKNREARIHAVVVYQQSPEGRDKRRAYRTKNRDHINERTRKWMREHRAEMRVHERRRRDRHRNAKLEGSHSFAEVQTLFATQNGLCANDCCKAVLVVERSPERFHEDHILAITLGGTDDISNIQLLCPTCNLRKHNLSPEQWEARRHEFAQPPTP